MIGRTLSHYRILDKLGSGGMGDVYLAEDTKLDRKVALKVLPPETVSEKRRERFKREAKAIAALDHPNIVQVFSVEEAEGIHFITMQLVQGKTLTHLIPKNGFPLSQFFDIAIPLADAVAAAHQEGITHRDLKPDNVMVTDDGRVKVLDFGLAKPTGGFARTDEASDVPTVAKTDEGVIVGTVSYMSPEQAEGKPADARSDVFSLGIVFYEMMTGRRPFEGDTPTAVLSSIIKDVPPAVSEIRSGISRELSRMVRRCLAKDRSRRLQNALDVRNELEECKSEMDSGVNIAAPTRQGFRWLPMLGGVALLVLVALSGYSLLRPNDVRKRLVRPRQLTSAIGVEQYATWSPDGGRLAYMSDQSGNSDVWVIQVGGGPPVNLTTNHPGFDGLPSWSPKGDQIAFLSDREDGGYFVVSALGGTPRRLLEILGPQTGSPPQWSPDAARLACVLYEDGAAVAEIVSLDSGAATRVPLPGREGYSRLDLAWSTDERFFAYVDARNYTAQVTQIRVVRLEDGESYAVTDGMTNALSPRWSLDGRTLYFVSNRDGSMDLWAQPMSGDGAPRGDPRPLTTGLAIRSATLSPDGTTLAYSRGREIRNIFRVPILSDRLATWDDAEQLTFDEAQNEQFDVSPDGTALLVSSDKRGNPDLWLVPLDGGEPQQITSDPTPDWAPRWSPDGEAVAFYSYRSGNREIWLRPLGRGVARQLTEGDAESVYPVWSPDGQEIAFSSLRGGNDHIWAVNVAGGELRQVTSGGDSELGPVYSPDGNWIYVLSFRDGRRFVSRVPAEGGEPDRITAGPAEGFPLTSADPHHIYFARYEDERGDIWKLSLVDGEERVLTNFEGKHGRLPIEVFATDEQYLYFSWHESTGDIWVMDVVQ